MGNFYDEEFISQVWALYLIVLYGAGRLQNYYPSIEQQYSAHNLTAFLIYKYNINVDFMTAMRTRGLCLSSIQNVEQSLQIICSNLGIVPPYQINFSMNPQAISNYRREAIFGKKPHIQSPHIMITLDAQMISSTIIEDFLTNGMTVARINCAYGDEAVWTKLIQSVRRAEEQLRKKGCYSDQMCKIYMDLAGPKIRIANIKKTTYPLKIAVKKNRYGQPIEYKKGFVSWNILHTKLLSNGAYDFAICVPHHKNIQLLKEGDCLTFFDIRNKKRQLMITKTLPSGFVVNLEKNAYIDESTQMENAERQVTVNVIKLEEKTVQLQVKKHDQVRIYLKQPVEEVHMTEVEPARVSVNLPEAFIHVRRGHSVFIDDGKIQGVVTGCNEEFIDIEIISPVRPTTLKENKGVNLPDSCVGLSVPSLTSKDEIDLRFICRYADIVGISFIHTPNDLRTLKQHLIANGRADIAVISKIETRAAIDNFSSILLEGLTFPHFGVMVARGDLAIDIGFQQLSVVQEEILSMCRAAHIPVILATQVLDTLAKKGNPSRSELADLWIGSEFDCIMLNKGPFMKETVEFLQETLLLISQVKNYKQSITRHNH